MVHNVNFDMQSMANKKNDNKSVPDLDFAVKHSEMALWSSNLAQFKCIFTIFEKINACEPLFYLLLAYFIIEIILIFRRSKNIT